MEKILIFIFSALSENQISYVIKDLKESYNGKFEIEEKLLYWIPDQKYSPDQIHNTKICMMEEIADNLKTILYINIE